MSYVDTRDLIERKEELEQMVLTDFNEEFPHYKEQTESFEDILFEEEEIQSWKEVWLDEIVEITDIEKLEDEIGSEFNYGVTLIPEDDFTDYVKDLLEDCGYIPKDFPSWIKVDWKATADNVRQDYTETEYNGITYLFRA